MVDLISAQFSPLRNEQPDSSMSFSISGNMMVEDLSIMTENLKDFTTILQRLASPYKAGSRTTK